MHVLWLTNLALSISIKPFLDSCTKIKYGGSQATPLSINVDYLDGSLFREHVQERQEWDWDVVISPPQSTTDITFNTSPCINRNIHMRISTSAHLLNFQLQCDFKIVLLKLQYNDRHIEMSIFLNLKLFWEEDTFYGSVGERNSFNRAHKCAKMKFWSMCGL